METSNNPLKPRLGYRQLEAWKQSRELAIKCVKVSLGDPMRRLRGLCDQIQRSSVSVPSNIAEGEERGSNKDSLRFLYIAKGSLAELRTQLDIARECGGINQEEFVAFDLKVSTVTALLVGLIKRRKLYEESLHFSKR